MKKNYLCALGAVLTWSTLAAVAKMVVSDIPNFQVMAVSSFISVAFLLIVNIVNGSIKKLKFYRIKDYAVMLGLGALGIFLYTALYYYGLSKLTSQEACILNYLWPIMIVIFSCIILKERLTAIKTVAIVCSFLGVVVLSLGGDGISSGGGALLGMVSCVIAAACYGLFSVLNKKADFDLGISMMIYWFVTGVLSGIIGLFTEEWTAIVGVHWIGILWIGIVVQAVAYFLWALALKGSDNTASVANLAYLTPFLSLIVSAVLLEEHITKRALIALVLIIGGILLQYFVEHRRAK